jgi:hypothetical protein
VSIADLHRFFRMQHIHPLLFLCLFVHFKVLIQAPSIDEDDEEENSQKTRTIIEFSGISVYQNTYITTVQVYPHPFLRPSFTNNSLDNLVKELQTLEV